MPQTYTYNNTQRLILALGKNEKYLLLLNKSYNVPFQNLWPSQLRKLIRVIKTLISDISVLSVQSNMSFSKKHATPPNLQYGINKVPYITVWPLRPVTGRSQFISAKWDHVDKQPFEEFYQYRHKIHAYTNSVGSTAPQQNESLSEHFSTILNFCTDICTSYSPTWHANNV